ncbi:MAG: hypothetical protein ACXWUM_00780 [Burkholderiaceae bacterium]
MSSWLRVVLAVVLGIVVGSVVNMALITVSGKVIAPPAGADVTTTEGLKASMHLFEPRHFIFPFLAHAVGTFVGAFVAALVAPGRSMMVALVVGSFFLLGGIASVFLLPAPLWFSVVDLLFAYLPAAWLGRRVAMRLAGERRAVAG